MTVIMPLITNNYIYDLQSYEFSPDEYLNASMRPLKTIKRGAEQVEANCAENPAKHLSISVPALGQIVFYDLEEYNMPGQDFLTDRKAVLIRYQKKEAYIRYDLIGPKDGPPPEDIWKSFCIVNRLGTLHMEDLLFYNPRPLSEGPRAVDALKIYFPKFEFAPSVKEKNCA